MKYAIIGGTGVYSAGESKQLDVVNEYGRTYVDVVDIDGLEVAFLPRHGAQHSVPPSKINYRANLKALKDLGVEYCFGTCAVGSMNEDYKPGDVVQITDFLEFTKGREDTFYTGKDKSVKHVGMHDPYCKNMRFTLGEIAKKNGLRISGDAVYVTTEGPRFETAAEIRFFKSIGGDVVGMTNYPEVVLAKELGMCYAAFGIITNWCTGMTGIGGDITMHDIGAHMDKSKTLLIKCFMDVFEKGLNRDNCDCHNSIIEL